MIIALADRKGGLFGYAARIQEVINSDCSISFIDRTSQISGDAVFLQYSGYGLARKGAPLWLLDTLKRDRSRYGTLGIFFHELYAIKPPWSSAFWLSPVQKYIARELVGLCDFWMTSCTKYGNWLSAYERAKPSAVLPVCSNVGEPRLSSATRLNHVVVFGSPAVRKQTYRAGGRALIDWLKRENLQLLDIGEEIQDVEVSRFLQHANAKIIGRQSELVVSPLLSTAKFGLLEYDARRLAKSGVFAAYTSHGLVPIVISTQSSRQDGLSAGTHFLSKIPDGPLSEVLTDAVAANAYSWYGGHTVIHHAETISDLFENAQGAAR